MNLVRKFIVLVLCAATLHTPLTLTKRTETSDEPTFLQVVGAIVAATAVTVAIECAFRHYFKLERDSINLQRLRKYDRIEQLYQSIKK